MLFDFVVIDFHDIMEWFQLHVLKNVWFIVGNVGVHFVKGVDDALELLALLLLLGLELFGDGDFDL